MEQPVTMLDADLVAAALADGPDGFTPIVKRYQDAVFSVALARLGNFHEAEDIAQTTFLTAYRQLSGLKEPARLGAWLRSIATHQAIDRVRRRKTTMGQDELAEQAAHDPAPHEQVEQDEMQQHVLEAVNRLSKAQRETTMLFYISGYSVAEVASIQEVPIGTVKRRLHSAREALKKEMIDMVKNTLHAEAPKDDFAGRVLTLLQGATLGEGEDYVPWQDLVAEIKRIGRPGVEGFIKALQSPHHKVRALAANTMRMVEAKDTTEVIVEVLTKALGDPNRKVRRMALDTLLNLDLPTERMRNELLPKVLPMMRDPSRRVRVAVTWHLRVWASLVPIEVVAQAMCDETDAGVQAQLPGLMRRVLAAREKTGETLN